MNGEDLLQKGPPRAIFSDEKKISLSIRALIAPADENAEEVAEEAAAETEE